MLRQIDGQPKLSGSKFIKQPAATQEIHIQSLRTKRAFLICHLEQVTEMEVAVCPIHGHILFHWPF
jgi:hypothetical protein